MRLGQRVTVLVTLPVSVALWLALSFSPNVFVLLLSWFFIGFTGYCLNVCAGLYTLEISHKSIRGKCVGVVNSLFHFGGLFIAVMGLLKLEWRQMGLIFSIVPTLAFFGALLLPNSPRWLVAQGRLSDAEKSLMYFMGQHYDTEKELSDIKKEVEDMRRKRNSVWQQLNQLFGPSTLRMFVLVTALNIFFGLNGYAVATVRLISILQDTKSVVDPYICALIYTGIACFGCLVQASLVDRVGRKFLFIISSVICCVSMMTLGGNFYMVKNGSVGSDNWFSLTSLVVFMFCVSIGQSVFGTIEGEEYPTMCRSLGMSLSVNSRILVYFIGIQLYPHMKEVLGEHGTFWFYGGCSAVLTVIALMLPETCNRTLEDITAEQRQEDSDDNVIIAQQRKENNSTSVETGNTTRF